MTDEAVQIPGIPPDIEVPDGDAPPNAVPVTIHLKNGKTFKVDDLHAWLFAEQGVFATGKFKDLPQQEQDILVPYDNVDYYVLHYDKLKKYLAAKHAAATLEIVGDTDAHPSP